MDAASSVTRRRTRSQWDEYYYRNYHNETKKKTTDKTDSNVVNGECTMKHDGKAQDFDSAKDESFVMNTAADPIRREDPETSSYEDSADDDSDEKYTCNYARRKRQRKPLKKKGRVVGEVDFDFDFGNMLKEDSRWKVEKNLIKENPAFVEKNDASQGILPLKFKFEDDDDSSLPEKTDLEKEIDSLFDDLEMGLWETEEGCSKNSSITDDDECQNTTETPAARCGRAEHEDVFDEQIGIICKYCYEVLLDIRYVLPPFHEEAPERHERDNLEESKKPITFPGSNSGNLESSIDSTGTIYDMTPDAEKGYSSNSGNLTGTVYDLIPDAEKELYPHQLEGFEFLWRNIAGDIRLKTLERLPSNGRSGCIISHAPGTGKTRLTIVFLQTFMRLYPNCRPLIIAPRGMLLTWEQEFKKWKVGLNFHNLNEMKLSDEEIAVAASVADQTQGLQKNVDYIRYIKMFSWMKGGSILGVGYRLFEELAGENVKKHDKFKKQLLELPGLLVLDEGHTPRNDQSLMWKALTKIKTQRRVILSGTPFQNNFDELYNTLCLVNPTFSNQIMSTSGGKKQGRKRKGNAARDEWANLTTSANGLKKLRLMIEPFVHIHKGTILQKTLPGMRDCLIILRPTDLQGKLLEKITQVVDKFLPQAHLASLVSVHPSLVVKEPGFSDYRRKLKSLKSDPNAGVKTLFLINLIELFSRLHEKVLIFSEYLDSLHHIKNLLKPHFSWKEGREVMYMDGELSIKQRQHLINSFNSKDGEAKVMLASLKACCEGINLVGASRVILLDVAWNPSVERQAICRAYRLGQEKMVYVYHLVTSVELKKYARQAEKDRISELIFSRGGGGEKSLVNNAVSEDKVLEAMVGRQSVGSMIERIIHQPKESDLVNTFGFVDV